MLSEKNAPVRGLHAPRARPAQPRIVEQAKILLVVGNQRPTLFGGMEKMAFVLCSLQMLHVCGVSGVLPITQSSRKGLIDIMIEIPVHHMGYRSVIGLPLFASMMLSIMAVYFS